MRKLGVCINSFRSCPWAWSLQPKMERSEAFNRELLTLLCTPAPSRTQNPLRRVSQPSLASDAWVFFPCLPYGEKTPKWVWGRESGAAFCTWVVVGRSPMVVSQNFSSATSLAMLAPINTFIGMPSRSPITSEMSFSPLGPSSIPWAQDEAQARCSLCSLRASHLKSLRFANALFISVPAQRSCCHPNPAKACCKEGDGI